MTERDGYIAGVPCWVDTSQPEPHRAAEFYRQLFGWTIEDRMPPGSDAPYLVATIRGGTAAAITGVDDALPVARTWHTFVAVDSADEAAARAAAAGATVVLEPRDVGEAGRTAMLADPEGALFSVWQAGRNRGLQVVNEHGALNFNGLATRDRAGAEAFYGELFGWKALDLPSGPMWALPGYGDHLEERHPGLRDQMAAMGAPDGFIDVVAAIEPIDPADDASPAHWTVTFGVDDVDEVAATATRLGATVVAGPFDAPWTRQAVIDDPQGTRFTASQFVPENQPSPGR